MDLRDDETNTHNPRYHVLLIGIDAYDGGASLNGCVNDIDAIQKFLLERAKLDESCITRLAAPLDERDPGIPEKPPTYANIKAALAELGSDRVQHGDRVLIYYSGHGTQVPVVAGGQTFMREALMPTDFVVRLTGRRYLFDWELNGLLANIAARTTSVAVVLDACCSGGATRDGFEPPGGKARFWPTTEPYELPGAPPPRASLRGVADGISATVSACVVAAACLDDERARESGRDAERVHGELTRALLRQLSRVTDEELAELRWGRIWRAMVADVASLNPAQHPWISGGLARRVLAGPPEEGDVGLGVSGDGPYRIDAGTLCGITEDAEIAVYGPTPLIFAPVGSPGDAPVGRLRVTAAGRSSATAAPLAPFVLPPGARGRLVAAGKAARLRVGLVPYDPAVAARLASNLFEVVDDPAAAVKLERRADLSWAVTDEVFGKGEQPRQPSLVVIPPALLGRAAEVLEHYFTYSRPVRLAKACTDLPKALRVKLFDCTNAAPLSREDAQDPSKLPGEAATDERGVYELPAGDAAGGGAEIAVVVQNGSGEHLTAWFVACQCSGAVTVFPPVQLAPGASHVYWEDGDLGRGFRLWLDDGRRLGAERLVVIGTTERDASLNHLHTDTTFADILSPARGDRQFGAPRSLPTNPPLWTASVVTLRSFR